MKSKPIYLWRKFVDPCESGIYEATLPARTEVAVITRPDRKRALLEVACKSRREARNLAKKFGGRIQELPANWLARFSRAQKRKPARIGSRLVILNVRGTSVSRPGPAGSRRKGPFDLVIPAGAAFGTGEHVTTAMSLRLLEQLTLSWKPGWSMVDLGTGSGILALAAKCLGAGRVLAIDNDPIAISTAKTNARLNKIDALKFQLTDLRRWKIPHKSRLRQSGNGGQVDIVTANLFSELLIEILPRLRQARWLILSGIMRHQERDLVRALKHHKIDIVQVRRRGKWIAIGATLS